jgi:hypothetical protein
MALDELGVDAAERRLDVLRQVQHPIRLDDGIGVATRRPGRMDNIVAQRA